MVAARRTLPGREHLRQTPMAAAHIMPKGQGRRPPPNAYGGSATHYAGVGTVGTTSSGSTVYAQRSLLWRNDCGVPSACRCQLLLYWLLQLRRLVHRWSGSCGRRCWVAVGAAVASANNSAAASNAYAAGVATGAAVASANNAAATTNAYNAGVAAGAASASYSMGEIVAAAPTGCATPTVGGMTYYLCGNTWFQPAYGANGVYYRVVPAP